MMAFVGEDFKVLDRRFALSMPTCLPRTDTVLLLQLSMLIFEFAGPNSAFNDRRQISFVQASRKELSITYENLSA